MTMAEVAVVEGWATRHRRAIVNALRVVLLLWAGCWTVFAVTGHDPDHLLLGGLLWAGCWTVFAVASVISEGTPAFTPALGLLCCLWGATCAAWRWPKGGGLVLVVAGMVFAWSFLDAEAWLLLAMPAIVLGLALTLVGRVDVPGGQRQSDRTN